ncbi:hypothetical protein [Rhizosaccharibacter radicis]|uniref:Glycosyltransferase RgtA/B/C/D-like domain-containing protein n=1 Tax=Rhizosaccharibacter radicis TaxID=2782605 RepID=A0ABT1VZ10_9PROT|nr:hypothetical protein [Acetobacteraceae bacterium KSS12]
MAIAAVPVAILVAIYLNSYLRLPYADHDPTMYAIIGHAMVHDGVVPYRGVFDHKPVLLYGFYGLWSLPGRGWPGEFTVLALGCCVLIAAIGARFTRGAFAVALSMLVLGGARFAVLAGNAECVYLPLILGALILMALGRERERPVLLVGAFALAAVAVNTNYLAGPSLLIPSAIAVLAPGPRRRPDPSRERADDGIAGSEPARSRPPPATAVRAVATRAGAALAGLSIGLLVALVPFIWSSTAIWTDYLRPQLAYLRHYGAPGVVRLQATAMFALFGLVLSPVLLLWHRRPVAVLSRWRRSLLFWWAISAWLACLASGHPFPHYFLLALAPVAIMASCLWRHWSRRWLAIGLVPLLVLSAVGGWHDVVRNQRLGRALAQADFERLRSLAGDRPVLSIEASDVPFFMAGLQPLGHYIFPGHVRTVFGTGASAFYLSALARRPDAVLIPPGWCGSPDALPPVCERLQRDFRPAAEAPGTDGFVLLLRRNGR